MKHCIFFLPYRLDETASRARMVRPRKMIQGFRDLGYDVFVITGYARERKEKIAELKKLIDAGVSFDFIYAEASTMPTLLTEPHHYPTHPFLDFGFFRYLKQKGINAGLFYPDIYWKFDSYGKELPRWKRFFAISNYRLDIVEYEKWLSRFYLPSLEMCDYIGSEKLSQIAEELPPGADEVPVTKKEYSNRDFHQDPLTLFYVGGIGGHYQLDALLQAVSMTECCRLILCCRKEEWEHSSLKDCQWLCDRIQVIHKSGKELEEYYREADLGSLMFARSEYMGFAKPVKAYEYLSHELPILITKDSGFDVFVTENGIGWALDYSAEAISKQLKAIIADPSLLEKVHQRIPAAKEKNTWKARARQVSKGLMSK